MKQHDLPEGYVGVTTHKFKTHFARYLEMLNDGRAEAVVIMRYDKPQGILFPLNKKKPKSDSNVD